jgi:hypothetical protein
MGFVTLGARIHGETGVGRPGVRLCLKTSYSFSRYSGRRLG